MSSQRSTVRIQISAMMHQLFLDPEGGSQKGTLVVVVVVISSLTVQKSLRLS